MASAGRALSLDAAVPTEDVDVGDASHNALTDAISISFKAVCARYDGSDVDALKDVSFFIPAGGSLGVCGRSGSGKSTLLAVMLRFASLREGSLTLGVDDVGALSLAALRKQIGVVLQFPVLFKGTIRDNFRVGCADVDSTDDDVTAAMATVGASLKRESMNWLDLSVGEEGSGLSVGERQLVAVAREILRRKPILFLDEIAAFVDGDTEGMIRNAVLSLKGKTTVVNVAHRVGGLLDMDRVIVLGGGRVIETGEAKALASSGGAFSVLLEAAAHGTKTL
jgi:ABC-type multidrug transport system fused ATPase/permease subunit